MEAARGVVLLFTGFVLGFVWTLIFTSRWWRTSPVLVLLIAGVIGLLGVLTIDAIT